MSAARKIIDAGALLGGCRRGDPLAIARAITAIENQTAVGVELALAVRDSRGSCRTLGVTGPPGAGKSSLINALMAELLPRYQRIGVLTVDPSSPVSGGAVLGDRVRMAAHSANPNVFIRSLAARGHLGGVTRTTRAVIDLLAVGGMDLVIVETVGTGQSEVEVAGLTQLKMAVCAPGLGDEMQAIKAGILEVADLLVVNKSDLPDAERTLSHLKSMLHHRGHEERRAALKVSTVTGDGLAILVGAIDARLREPGPVRSETIAADRHLRWTLADDVGTMTAALVRDSADVRIDEIIDDMTRGVVSNRDGVMATIRILPQCNPIQVIDAETNSVSASLPKGPGGSTKPG